MPKIILEDVRCSYVYVNDQRKKDNGDDGGWGIQVLVPKNHPQIKQLKKAIDQALAEKHGNDALKKKGRYKLPLRDPEADDEDKDGEEYENMYFLNANSKKKKPGIANRQGQIADQDDIEEYCFSGAYFHVSINLYGYPPVDGGKPGVAVGLNNVMLRKKGERLDGTVAATSEFSSFASDDPNDDDDGWGDDD